MNNLILLAETSNNDVYQSAGAALAVTVIMLLTIITLVTTIIVFWVIALIHLIKHEDVKDRIVWLVLLLAVGSIIGPIYFFAVKKPYDKEKQNEQANIEPKS